MRGDNLLTWIENRVCLRARKRKRTPRGNFFGFRLNKIGVLDYERLDVYQVALEFVINTIQAAGKPAWTGFPFSLSR